MNERLLESYTKLGTPEEIRSAMTESGDLLSKYARLGTPEELATKIKALEHFTENVGPLHEVEGTMDRLITFFDKNGTPSEITEVLEKFENTIEELGTPAEIREAFAATERHLKQSRRRRNEELEAPVEVVDLDDEEDDEEADAVTEPATSEASTKTRRTGRKPRRNEDGSTWPGGVGSAGDPADDSKVVGDRSEELADELDDEDGLEDDEEEEVVESVSAHLRRLSSNIYR